jgi:hypothetical protein
MATMFIRAECVWLLAARKLHKVYINNPIIKDSLQIYVILGIMKSWKMTFNVP